MTDRKYLEKYLDKAKLQEGLEKLEEGIPLQYIIGDVNFYGNIIKVNSNVLIPRFETELLVDKTIKYAKTYLPRQIDVIDLGTGSGAIAISLKKKLTAMVDATDISNKALEVALENAKINETDINFFISDIFSDVTKSYDLIISNPPYVSKNEAIEDIVKKNEPAIALFADNDGLEFYEKILSNAKYYLKKPGLIALEIGRTQGKKVAEIAKNYFPDAKIKIEKDFPGEDRFVFIFN